MRKQIFILIFSLIGFACISQETYTVNGQAFELIKETNGSIELLWNEIDGVYRYFVKKDNSIVELTNTPDDNGNYKFEYRITLSNLTSDENLSTNNIRLTLIGLKKFIDEYNTRSNPNYEAKPKAKLLTRFSVLGGVTNSPFIDNPENIINPILGVEFEFSEAINLPKHSIYFQGKQVIGSDKFDYSATQIIVGYRFRFVNAKAFNIYANLDVGQYVYAKTTTEILDEDVLIEQEFKDNGFEAPFTFGVGADIKLSDIGFLSLVYNELFSLMSKNKGNFPTCFAVGYKFKL